MILPLSEAPRHALVHLVANRDVHSVDRAHHDRAQLHAVLLECLRVAVALVEQVKPEHLQRLVRKDHGDDGDHAQQNGRQEDV